MNLLKNGGQSAVSILLSLLLIISSGVCALSVNAAGTTSIEYTFKGDNIEKAGYAEGTIKLNVESAGDYKLYWADDNGALDGYYPIAPKEFLSSGSKSFTFDKHTTIPAGATRIIALNKSNSQVAQYVLPEKKRLNAGKLLYTFNSYSDIHIDKDKNGVFYTNASKHWSEALKFGVDMNTDFIVTSGDTVTNATGPDAEWEEYERILSESNYLNPVWESDGNHDMRSDKESGLKAFIRATGTDSTTANYDANKPYYYMVEKNSGDVFIFMALEGSTKSAANESSQFSDAQLNWLDNLLKKYYGTGVNVYIVEHSPIKGFGAGDRMSDPYYKGHISESFESTKRFKEVLKNYPGLIFMSGHSHEDFSMGYNYSNENNTACNMIHNPSVAGTTIPNNPDDGKLDYTGGAGSDAKGVGLNSQGYYVEVYDNEVIFYGANISDGLIYPEYSYIMEGSRTSESDEDETDATSDVTESPSETVAETSTEAEKSEPATENTTAATEEMTEPETEKSTEINTEPEFETGDVNMDGGINVKDATLIQKATAKILTLSDKQAKLADTDFNGAVNIKDATLIQKYSAKLIDSFEKNSSKKTAKRTGTGGLSEEITKVYRTLASYYSFSSYDQYQELKKLYYKYKNTLSAENESEVIAEFENKLSNLHAIADHISSSGIYLIGDTYYFENTNNWGSVYAYAWRGTSNNASWPGVKLSKVGTNAGHDVYALKFDSAAQYTRVIFNGGKDNPQTIDIPLEKYKGNCFYLDGTSSDGKLKVGSFTYKDGTQPVSDEVYALYYYTANHAWGYDESSFFSKNGDGSFSFKYTAPDSNDLSFNVYNTNTKKYNCVASSTPLTYSVNSETQYTLSESSSRGKSITVSGLSAGAVLKMTYNPGSNTLKVVCE